MSRQPRNLKFNFLNMLRYIHANPKAAGMQQGYFYDYSNYGMYDRLTNDGITQWHPAFLALAVSLELCAEAYRQFCKQYKPQPKPEKKNHWGSKLLAKLKQKRKPQKTAPGQQKLPWDSWDIPNPEIQEVSRKFILANCFNPDLMRERFEIENLQTSEVFEDFQTSEVFKTSEV